MQTESEKSQAAKFFEFISDYKSLKKDELLKEFESSIHNSNLMFKFLFDNGLYEQFINYARKEV